MTLRKLLIFALAVSFVLILVALTTPLQTAYACLPCYCPDRPSVNCYGDYSVFVQDRGDGCYIQIWTLDRQSNGTMIIEETPEDIAAVPLDPTQHQTLAVEGTVALYRLTSGEYQVNFGPDYELNYYTLNFTGCPASNIRETKFTPDGQSTPLRASQIMGQ